MSKFHGKNIRAYIAGYDMSGFFDTIDIKNDADTVDVAGFGDSTKNYVVGLYANEIDHTGFFDDSPSGAHNNLSALLGSIVGYMALIGTDQGAYGFAGSAEVEDKYDLSASIKGAVLIKTHLYNGGTQGIDPVQVVQPKTQISGTGAAWDSGTVSNNGGRAYIQNFGSYNSGLATPANSLGSARLVGGTDAAFSSTGTFLLADFGLQGTAPSTGGISFSGTVPEFLHLDSYSGTPQVAIALVRL